MIDVERKRGFLIKMCVCLIAFTFLCGIGSPAVGPDLNPFTPITAAASPSPSPSDSGGGGGGASGGPADIFDDFVGTEGGKITVGNGGEGDGVTTLAGVIGTYKNIAAAITGILTVTMLILMLVQFTKLGAAGDNEIARKKAIMGILTTGIATALLGGATIVIGFFWNALSNTTPT